MSVARGHDSLQDCITAGELIKYLSKMSPDAMVMFACDYGDHSHTTQLLPICGFDKLEELGTVNETAYSKSGLMLREFDDDNDDDDDNCFGNRSGGIARSKEINIVVLQ